VWSLTSNDTPTTTPYSDSPPRVTYPKIFFQPSLPSFYLKSLLRHSKAPTSTLRQHHVRIPLIRVTYPKILSRLSTSILTILTKDFTQALATSKVTPTPTQCSDSPPRVSYPKCFPAPLPTFLHIHEGWSLTSNVTPTQMNFKNK